MRANLKPGRETRIEDIVLGFEFFTLIREIWIAGRVREALKPFLQPSALRIVQLLDKLVAEVASLAEPPELGQALGAPIDNVAAVVEVPK